MRKQTHSFFVLFLTIFSLCSTSIACAATSTISTQNSNPWATYMVPSEPNVNAKSYVLMNVQSGTIVASKNADIRMQPASLTKLMTLDIVFSELASGRIHLDDKVRISKKAWQTGGSRMFVRVGSEVPVKDLLQGVIVQSGNDATMALAEYIGGTEAGFVQMMDQEAAVLGMKKSHFSDPTGLPMPDHLTTAHDLAILARHIIITYPQYYHFFGEKWFTWNKIRQPNRNRLLWRNLNVDGLKTGHTAEAGFCMVSSAMQDSTRFLTVVMGTPTDDARQNDSQALLSYGFRFFQSAKIYNANDVITQQRVWKGEDKYLSLGVAKDFYVSIPRRAYSDLKVTLSITPNITAPIAAGQTLGSVQVYLKNMQIATAPLVALKADAKGGWWTRLIDAISHWFHNLFHKDKGSEVLIGKSTS